MKDSELIEKVHSSVYHQCQKRGYATPVDVLIDVGVLDKKKYEDWRFGRIPRQRQTCKKAVCVVSLRHQKRVIPSDESERAFNST